jgi:hypothetical protein
MQETRGVLKKESKKTYKHEIFKKQNIKMKINMFYLLSLHEKSGLAEDLNQ